MGALTRRQAAAIALSASIVTRVNAAPGSEYQNDIFDSIILDGDGTATDNATAVRSLYADAVILNHCRIG